MGIAKGNINKKQFWGGRNSRVESRDGVLPVVWKEGVKTDNIETGINFLAVKVGERLELFFRDEKGEERIVVSLNVS